MIIIIMARLASSESVLNVDKLNLALQLDTQACKMGQSRLPVVSCRKMITCMSHHIEISR